MQSFSLAADARTFGQSGASSGRVTSQATPATARAEKAIEGTVKWYDPQKGYGFIKPDGGGKDIFVHVSAVSKAGLTNLFTDQRVKFGTEQARDGRPTAVELAILR